MTENQYIKSVLHKLHCTRQKKKAIEKELRADIQMAIEAGESWEDIEIRMGAPKEAAQEFNENFPPEEEKRVKRQRITIALCGIVCVLVALFAVFYWILPKEEIANEKGKEHGETFLQVQRIISLVEEEDYETMKQKYCDEILKESLTKEQMDFAKTQIAEDWGNQVSIGKLYVSTIDQMGETYKAVQVNVSYEHAGVTYTLLFDREKKLAGLYLK